MESIINLFHLDTFYRLCADYVQYYPQYEHECERLQTFAAVESYADLNSPNLGKTILDRDKPYFFSRQWAAAKFNPSKLSASGPIMTAFEEPGLFATPFDSPFKTYYNLQLAWLDQFELPKPADKRYCVKRTRNEIFKQTEEFAKNFFTYLSKVAYYDGIGFINEEIAAAAYPGSPQNTTVTRQLRKMLSDENKQVQHVRWEGGVNNYTGTYVTIKLCSITCSQFFYDPSVKEYKIGFDAGCC